MEGIYIIEIITISSLFGFLSVVITSIRDIIINKDNLRYSEKKDRRNHISRNKKR